MSLVVPKNPGGTGNLPALRMDKVPVTNLTSAVISEWRKAAASRKDWFWSTPARRSDDATREVVEINLAGPRLINYLAFSTAHFPHVVYAEYHDPDTAAWLPFRTVAGSATKPVATRSEQFWTILDDRISLGPAATYLVNDSAPVKVNPQSAIGYDHPQHFGAGHWVPVTFRVRPVQVQRIRLVLVRNPTGFPPVNQTGSAAAYSLAVKDWQIGYRISAKSDVPRYGDVLTNTTDFASSNDLLGSRVVYSLSQQKPLNVTDGLDTTVWRSNPQPVNYSVVNFYADTRDGTGDGQVIDRFYVDPTTVGAHVNLYYSNDDPDANFEASDEPLTYPIAQTFGSSATNQATPTRTQERYVSFSERRGSFIDIDNAFVQFDPTKPWWFGLGLLASSGTDGLIDWLGDPPDNITDHPWFSFGNNVLRQNGAAIEFVNEWGEVASVPLPVEHDTGALFSIQVIWNPVPTKDFGKGLTLVYRLGANEPVIITTDTHQFSGRPAVLSVGRYPDFDNPGNCGLLIRSMILKVKPPYRTESDQFGRDPYNFVRKDDFGAEDDATTDNAILRLHPMFSTPQTNPTGLVGGAGDQYENMVWTPIAQDYTLKKGFLYVPPTRARYWKFEFTKLVPENYESFVPIRREIKIFNTSTVQRYEQIAGVGSYSGSYSPKTAGPGVKTQMDLTNVSRYSDAVDALRLVSAVERGQASVTQGLVINDLSAALQAVNKGWVWSFQPWHTGSSAPRFVTTQRHEYETLTIEHRTKVGFFAGLKTLRAYRVDYLADDDVEQYVEHFHDTLNIDTVDGVQFSDNTVRALGYTGTVSSKTFRSHRPVRGLQFATTQSDSQAVLADDGFVSDDLGAHWDVYGDAQLSREQGSREVKVNRGWYARTYRQVESQGDFATYANLNGKRYGEIEGGQPNGLAGGGIQSERYTPSNSGRLYAAAQITADTTLNAPVQVQLVAAEGDVVLASTSVTINAGQTAKVWTGYTVGSAPSPLRYSDLQGQTYGALDATTYRSHESRPIESDVYVRVVQTGATTDAFRLRRVSIFDDPIAWDFSVDNGKTWCDAMDVRNNASGVLTFPEPGTELKWRMRTYRPDASVTALAIRPWYGGLLGTIPYHHGMKVMGPNRSVMDQFPSIETDPMWKQWDSPVPRSWYEPPSVEAVVPDPGVGQDPDVIVPEDQPVAIDVYDGGSPDASFLQALDAGGPSTTNTDTVYGGEA